MILDHLTSEIDVMWMKDELEVLAYLCLNNCLMNLNQQGIDCSALCRWFHIYRLCRLNDSSPNCACIVLNDFNQPFGRASVFSVTASEKVKCLVSELHMYTLFIISCYKSRQAWLQI